MVRGLFMPLGRVILEASEARVSGQASRCIRQFEFDPSSQSDFGPPLTV